MLTPIRAENISAPHGFFSRIGGVSTGRYEGLNCGAGSDDAPAAVAENRSRVAHTLNADDLISVHQVHSAEAMHITGPHQGERPKLDGMVRRPKASRWAPSTLIARLFCSRTLRPILSPPPMRGGAARWAA